MEAFALPYRNRVMLLAILRQAIRERTASSALGFVFILIYPVLFLLVYALVFIFILRVKVPNLSAETYSIVIFCGLVPFLAFADALSLGTSSIVNHANLVKNIIFPYQLLPLKDAVVAHYVMSYGMVGLIVAAVWDRGISPTLPLVPFIYLLQTMFAIGIAWILSICNVFFRDLSKMMPIIILFLMMLSPIAYTQAMIPSNLRVWILLNPVSPFIFLYRDILLDHAVNWFQLMQVASMAIVSYLLGFFVITRLRPLVFDHV